MMIQKHIGYTNWNDNFRADKLPATTLIANSQKPTAINGGYTFQSGNGYVAMEAEHYYRAEASEDTQWSVYPYYGRTRSAVALTPYTKPVGNASLTYRFSLPEGTDKVKVRIIVKSTLDFLNVGGHECLVSLDGCQPETVNFNKTLLDKQPYMYSVFYPTVARRVIEKEVELPVETSNLKPQNSNFHELNLRPQHPGLVFEKIVVDFGGYKPSYLFMLESDYTRQQ
jgi:hypothetical protein